MEQENNNELVKEKINVVKYETGNIRNLIYIIRGKQVMIDSDVAMLYHYETKNINKAMKRNVDRFPEDFCFQLTLEELKEMWFQNGTTFEKENIKYRSEKLYHVGASLKDLGKKSFAISKIEDIDYVEKISNFI